MRADRLRDVRPTSGDVPAPAPRRLRLIDGHEPETGGDEEIPLPLTTLVNRLAGGDGLPPMFAVERSWHAADARRCGLCERCEATFFASGFAACTVHGLGTIADGTAPLHVRRAPATSSDAS